MLLRNLIREEDDLAVDVPRGSAGGLDERGLRAQVALLVRVEDANQADFGQVEALAKKVDADQHVTLSGAQSAKNLDPLDRIDVTMKIANLQADVAQVVGEILGGPLRQSGDQVRARCVRCAGGTTRWFRRSGSSAAGP